MSILALPENIDICVLDALSPGELLRYSRTCKAAKSNVQEYMKHAFCVDRLLSRYFTTAEILRFRELQCLTGALISGSTAVQFFDRTTYPDSDLDVYVEHKLVRPLAEWLVEIGFKYTPLAQSANMATLDAAFATNPPERGHVPQIDVEDVFFSGQHYAKSSLVLNFEKKHPQRVIQLITSLTSPLQSILDFHSTCVMNIIAHDKAYSFFPKATFERRYSLRFYQYGDVSRKLAAQKYVRRGWAMTNMFSKRYPVDAFPFGTRYVGDSMCWTLPVYPALELPSGYAEANSWFMRTEFRSSQSPPKMKATIMTAPVLKFAYTLAPEEAVVVRERICNAMLASREASGETSEMDTDYLRDLKKTRGVDEGNADNLGGSSKIGESSVPLETAFAHLNVRYRFRALPRFENVGM